MQNNGKEVYKKSVLHLQRCFLLIRQFCYFWTAISSLLCFHPSCTSKYIQSLLWLSQLRASGRLCLVCSLLEWGWGKWFCIYVSLATLNFYSVVLYLLVHWTVNNWSNFILFNLGKSQNSKPFGTLVIRVGFSQYVDCQTWLIEWVAVMRCKHRTNWEGCFN